MKKLMFIAVLATTSSVAMSAETLTWSGDFRFRNETIDQKNVAPNEKEKSNTQRMRARLSLMAQPTEDTKIETRIATGNGGISTNQTFNQVSGTSVANGNYTIALDRANVSYTGLASTTLAAGRMGVPFLFVGGSELIWDADENLDGLAANYNTKVAGADLMVKAGSFDIAQTKAISEKEASLQAYQLATKTNIGETKLTVQASYFNFVNLRQIHPGNGSSNALISNTAGLDYKIFNAGAQVDVASISVYFDYAKNTAGNTNGKNTAYTAGVKTGAIKDAGSWTAGYAYKKVEKDAVVDTLTDSDTFHKGGTDGKGHKVWAGYAFNSALSLNAQYFNGKQTVSTVDQKFQKLQLDLIAKF